MIEKRTATLSLLFLLVIGCSKPAADSGTVLPTTQMQIGSRQFVLEKATTSSEQEFGLMRRDTMAADHGMIFIFSQNGAQTFWNHDVRFPLDNLFVDEFGQVVSIQHMDAYSDASTRAVQCRYVIELNAGVPSAAGVHIGDRLVIPADAMSK